jgi:hypothetical protein
MTREEVDEYWERKGKYLYEERLNSRNAAPYRAAPHVEFITEDEKWYEEEITFPKYCYFGIVFCALVLGIAIGYLVF